MKYNHTRKTWQSDKENTMRYYYEKDKSFYDSLVWCLTAFMLGLVLGVGLMIGGVI